MIRISIKNYPLFLFFVFLGACHPATSRDNEEISIRGDTLVEKMDNLLLDIEEEVADLSCTNKIHCASIPIGDRPCGGPEWYVIYSTISINENKLEQMVDVYTALDEEHNIATGAMSICSYEFPPTLDCVDNKCREREIDE